MSADRGIPKALPPRSSLEHLRGQAKRLAKAEGVKLAAAHQRLARDYGFANWTALVRHVEATAPPTPLPPLHQAAQDSDLAEARRLLDAGASPREGAAGGLTPLHIAAARGPWAMVDLMIRSGALAWQPDDKGRNALAYAQAGTAPDRAEIAHKLDRPVIEDPDFRLCVKAIQTGDLAALVRQLDARPALLHMRAVEPDCYPATDYFGSPRLLWFVAGNPALVPRLPENIVAIMAEMIRRGVEQADLDYALELTMTSDPARDQGLSTAMIAALADAGAQASPKTLLVTLGHGETAPVEILLARGMKLSVTVAAGLGRHTELSTLLRAASRQERQDAFGMAVLNRQTEAARLCLQAGADVNARMPVHVHATGLHSAVAGDDLDMVKLLVAHGARIDALDTLWRSTPLGWAEHENSVGTRTYLEGLASG